MTGELEHKACSYVRTELLSIVFNVKNETMAFHTKCDTCCENTSWEKKKKEQCNCGFVTKKAVLSAM